jgi:hypothetical protein
MTVLARCRQSHERGAFCLARQGSGGNPRLDQRPMKRKRRYGTWDTDDAVDNRMGHAKNLWTHGCHQLKQMQIDFFFVGT